MLSHAHKGVSSMGKYHFGCAKHKVEIDIFKGVWSVVENG